MKNYYNKNAAIELKGFGILIMIWLHLCCHDELLGPNIYYSSILGGGGD